MCKIVDMSTTSDQVRDEVRRRVTEATEQLQRQLRVREVVLKRDSRIDMRLHIVRVVPGRDGVIVEVALDG